MSPVRIVSAALIALMGCADTTAPEYAPEDLASAPTSLTVAGQIVPLQADIWRDFMPSSNPDTRLAVVIRLEPAAPSLTVRRIHLLLGSEVWVGDASLGGGSRDWVARHGPKWDVGLRPDVIAEMRLPNGDLRLVRVPSVPILAVF